MPVERLGLLEPAQCRFVVAAGGVHLGHDHRSSVPVLADGGAFSEDPRRFQVRFGAREVIELSVELGQADVQVGGGTRVRLAVPDGGLERLLEQRPCAAGSSGGDPHVGEHDRAVQRIDSPPGGVQAADRLGEHGQCLLDVPRRKGSQPEEPTPGPAQEMVLGSGKFHDAASMEHRAVRVSACLRQ